VLEVGDGEASVAIVHDAALSDHPELMDAVRACAVAMIERDRLTAALRSSLDEVQASRARLAAAASEERRRIERDLHDGAQQQLVTLRLKLDLAGELVERDPVAGAARMRELGAEVEEILEDVRSLAHGIYPTLLADAGLVEALRSVARRCALPTTVEADGLQRQSPEIESAVYFCCLEAIQNAVKHAGEAATVTIRLEEADELRFTVADDGVGFDASSTDGGAGMTNMRDRLAAVGGELAVLSAVGHGTCVSGTVPV
jgi:signal transduction histidine kinase